MQIQIRSIGVKSSRSVTVKPGLTEQQHGLQTVRTPVDPAQNVKKL